MYASLSVEKKETSSAETDRALFCPITGRLFADPVDTECKHTFEREAIEQWKFQKANEANEYEVEQEVEQPCPTCKRELKDKPLVPNEEAKAKVAELVAKNPEKYREMYISATLAKELHDTIRKNDFGRFGLLIQNNKQLAFVMLSPNTSLISFICNKKTNVQYLEAFCNALGSASLAILKSQDNLGFNALFWVFRAGDSTRVSRMIEILGVEVEQCAKLLPKNKENLVHQACCNTDPELVKRAALLIGGDIKEHILSGNLISPPFHTACEWSTPAVITLLLECFKYVEPEERGQIYKLFSTTTTNAFVRVAANGLYGAEINLLLHQFLIKTLGQAEASAFISFCEFQDRRGLESRVLQISNSLAALSKELKSNATAQPRFQLIPIHAFPLIPASASVQNPNSAATSQPAESASTTARPNLAADVEILVSGVGVFQPASVEPRAPSSRTSSTATTDAQTKVDSAIQGPGNSGSG